jgi:hypothetical protein
MPFQSGRPMRAPDHSGATADDNSLDYDIVRGAIDTANHQIKTFTQQFSRDFEAAANGSRKDSNR